MMTAKQKKCIIFIISLNKSIAQPKHFPLLLDIYFPFSGNFLPFPGFEHTDHLDVLSASVQQRER